MSTTRHNPWAGLASYQDPELVIAKGEEPLLFCGRENESYDVAQLIDDHIFVTLYGKSGTGKTSLLNAGVFPRLRKEQYLPVSIRLGMDAIGTTFQECIRIKVRQAYEGRGFISAIDVVPLPTDTQSVEYLWSLFARTRFTDNDGRALFPVIVFDQFEEVFRERRRDAEALLRQIHFMMDESHALSDRVIDNQPYAYDFNFRFVASIREDDLYRLEDSIDNNYLADMKRSRYRLRSLTPDGARAAILTPGEGLFPEAEQEAIVNTLIGDNGIARNQDDQSISTNVLSLVCSRIYVDFQKSDAQHITQKLVETFVKENPFERFYKEATKGFSNREKSYIEEHLIDSTGERRNSVLEKDLEKALSADKVRSLLEGENRILQRTSTSSDGTSSRIELIHDSFCAPLAAQKEKRERRRRLKWLASAAAVFLVCMGVMGYIGYQMNKIRNQEGTISEQEEDLKAKIQLLEKQQKQLEQEKAATLLAYQERGLALTQADSLNSDLTLERDKALGANWRMLYNQSLVVSKVASTLADEGDSYTSRLLALAVLPKDLSHPDRPYTVEAESTLRKLCQHNNAVLRGHTDDVYSAAFSPDGKRIVSASRDGTIRIWDALTGKQTGDPLEGHTDYVYSAAFSPDGKRIVSTSRDKTIRIWDAQTGKPIGDPFLGHTGVVTSADFSPDGKRIVSASSDKTIRIWDVETGKQIGTPLEGHTDYIYSAAFSPDGKRIVSASDDKTVRIWDSQTGKQIGDPLEGHTHFVRSAAFSPDGKRIVSASWDKTIRIWNAQTGKQIDEPLEGHTYAVLSANFSPDGKYIVSASEDKTIRIWDVQTGKQIGEPLLGHTGSVISAAFSPDGKCIVSASYDKTIRIWDAQTGNQKGYPLEEHTQDVASAAFSPDGKHIVSASWDKTIRIWDAQTGKQIGEPLEGHTGVVRSASFSPDGKRIVSASWDGTIRIWDAHTGKQIGEPLVGHTHIVLSAVFSPDGKRIVSTSGDRTIRIWDPQTGKQIGDPLEGHTFRGNYAAFSPDGKRIVIASSDNTIRIWDAQTGKMIGNPLVGHTSYVISASFSPDGKRIVSASSDNTVRIWDAQRGKQIGGPLEGHSGYVYSVAFSPDGKRIVSASQDKTIRIWDTQTGKQIGEPLQGHTDYVNSAAFSPDGKRIVSASSDNTIRIWDFPPLQELIDQTRERFKDRKLTPEEKRKYYLE